MLWPAPTVAARRQDKQRNQQKHNDNINNDNDNDNDDNNDDNSDPAQPFSCFQAQAEHSFP